MDKHVILALFHVGIVAPLFIYVGVQRAGTSDLMFKGLVGLGLFMILYHGYKAFTKWSTGTSGVWVNLIHILLIAPLLIWIGYYGKDTSRAAFELLLMTGFAALGYHLYSLYLSLNTVTAGKD